MLTSKEVLDQTGISRATLNNYIASGIVPKPKVLPPGPDQGDAPRIGHFPDEVVARIQEIQRLKSQGWSLARIAQHLAGAADKPPPARPPVAHEASAPSPQAAVSGQGMTPVAVLAAKLGDPHRTWAALPPGEYFELINQIWIVADPIVRRHHGVHGKQASDGMVCYFFPRPASNYLWNALSAGVEIREAMRAISSEWQLRKGWPLQIHLNGGIDEGQEWLGNLKSHAQPEFAGLAGTLRRATRIAESARAGSLWVTKNLVLRLASEERGRLQYGVRQINTDGEEIVVGSMFTPLAGASAAHPAEAAEPVAVAEVIDILPRPSGP